jgi:hypothetical protein
VNITINMDRLCPECGKGGACDNGICLGCTTKAMNPKAKMRSAAGRAVQERSNATFARIRTGDGQ